MDSIISVFHIDVKLLLAQALNFVVIFIVLYVFAFKPIAKIMQERTTKIEKSVADAKAIEERLAATNLETAKILGNAKKEANEILEKANVQANTNRDKLLAKTKEEIAVIMKQEKEEIAVEKDAAFKELKKEVTQLAILAAEKVINEKMDKNTDAGFIKKIL
jgi:F-type H+-transporting ATPase subunit b